MNKCYCNPNGEIGKRCDGILCPRCPPRDCDDFKCLPCNGKVCVKSLIITTVVVQVLAKPNYVKNVDAQNTVLTEQQVFCHQTASFLPCIG